jgi:hypothetical protein
MDAVDENVEQTDDTEDVQEPNDRRTGEETAISSSVTAVADDVEATHVFLQSS